MDLIQLFLGANLVELLMRILFLLVGGLLMYIFFPMFGSATRILYCRERDGRGSDLAVKAEDEIRLDTANNLRFFKYGRSYAFTGMMNRLKTIFFAKEGTAYTWMLQGFTSDADNPDKVKLEFPTLWDAVRHKLGDEFLKPFPQDKREILMEDKMLVTVDLEPGLTPAGYTPATEQDISDKGKRDMAKLLGEAARQALHGGMLDKIPWIGVGIAVGVVGAIALGWIPVGSVG